MSCSLPRRFQLLPSIAPLLLLGCGGDLVVARNHAPAAGADASDSGIVPESGAALADDGGIGSQAPACDYGAPSLRAAAIGMCDETGYCWENPLPFGDIASVATPAGAADPWLVSFKGLMRRQGDTWINAAPKVPLDEVDGAYVKAPDDIWAFGPRGFVGVLVHYDGKTWTDDPSSKTYGYNKISGSASGAVWAVANDGSTAFCRRYDGKAWQTVPGLSETYGGPDDILQIEVVADDDVWVVTTKAIHHYSAGAWTTLDLDPALQIGTVWAPEKGSAWFGGLTTAVSRDPGVLIAAPNKGVLLHWDGKAVSPVSSFPDVTTVTALGGTGPADLWIGTEDGEIAHYGGTRFSYDPAFHAPRSVYGFAARGPSDVDALLDLTIGGILHWDGNRWLDPSPFSTRDALNGVWGSAVDDVWAVGANGLKLHFDGTKWTRVAGDSETYNAIWGTARDNVWATTEGGAIEHYDGSTWSVAYRHTEALGALWGTGPASLWITGVGFVAHFDGAHLDSWPANIQRQLASTQGTGIWASSDHDVWAAGGGPLQHYDGTSWQDVTLPEDTFRSTRSVWGRNSKDIWVGSFPTELHHFDGTTWTRVTGAGQAPEQAPGFPVQIGGCGDQAVWIATGEGVTWFDGTTWSESRPRTLWLNAIWGVSPDNLVGVGPGASIFRHAP